MDTRRRACAAGRASEDCSARKLARNQTSHTQSSARIAQLCHLTSLKVSRCVRLVLLPLTPLSAASSQLSATSSSSMFSATASCCPVRAVLLAHYLRSIKRGPAGRQRSGRLSGRWASRFSGTRSSQSRVKTPKSLLGRVLAR